MEYGSLTAIKKPRGEEREDAAGARSPLNDTPTGSGGPRVIPGLLFGAIIINLHCIWFGFERKSVKITEYRVQFISDLNQRGFASPANMHGHSTQGSP